MQKKSNKFNSNENLIKAKYAIIERDYIKAKQILLEIVANREADFRTFYLLGISCFFSNERSIAKDYFNIVLNEESNHIISKLYLAVIALLEDDEISNVVQKFIDCDGMLDEIGNKKHKTYKKYINNALYYIKIYSNGDDPNFENYDKLRTIFSNPYKNKILPQFGIQERYKKIVRNFTGLFILLALIAGGGIFLINEFPSSSILKNITQKKNDRTFLMSEIEKQIINQENKEKGIDKAFVILNDREFKRLMGQIEKDFISYKDNELLVKANTILYSNRTELEKNKILLIIESLKGVNYTSDVRWFEFNEIIDELWKYNRVTIKWKGTIAKVVANNDNAGQDFHKAQFLINFYGDSKELFASVPLYIPKYIVLNNGAEVEILATIKMEQVIKDSDEFELELISYRYLLNQ